MASKNIYICETPVVLITFNRPEETKETFLAIKNVKPKKLIFISDGPRMHIKDEIKLVNECRDLVNQIDWDCEVIKIFSDVNLGCMRRIVTGLTEVFSIEERAIILEDDCMPNVSFFKFVEWGLNNFENDTNIGMISGSNLIAHKHSIDLMNGFSNYINIWGWATWRRVWMSHNPHLSLKEIKLNMMKNTSHLFFNWWESIYWKELFKYTVYAGSTWDFQLQYTFFKLKLLSVYPNKNLVYNIGFAGNGTHTNTSLPDYVRLTQPNSDLEWFKLEADFSKKVLTLRDKLLAKEIWSLYLLTAIRLKIMNFLRMNF
jgi:hypothetical protein